MLQVGRHRCRLQTCHGRPAEAAVSVGPGRSSAGTRDEQTRRPSVIFLETPLLARDCRIYIHDVALRLGVPVKGSGLREGIEVFPKHDVIAPGGFGNAIRGPLGIHRGASRRFWFYGADYTVEAQIAYLNRLRKLTEPELQRFIAGKEKPKPDNSPKERSTASGLRGRTARPEFRILEHVGPV